jgi:hypothetical protein
MRYRYPSFNEYQAALQNPGVYFTLDFLRDSVSELDLWGLPRVRSGGFALTYRMTSKEGQNLAVRCFHKPVEDRTQRYAAIATYLIKVKQPFFLPIHYQARGISFKNQLFPITYMDWVDGETLESWLYSNLNDLAAIEDIAKEFVTLAEKLADLGVAHGDLSHRNIMVKDHKLILVDYDGMYVPALEGKASSELGNIHFQHPARVSTDFNSRLDRFSEIIIFLALSGLARRPQLWGKYQTGEEGLLFNRSTFLDPFQSPLLQELETLADLRSHIQLFRKICVSPFETVPSLSDFLALKSEAYSSVEVAYQTAPVHKITYAAKDRYPILRNLGKTVTVVGMVTEVFRGTSPDGHPHILINLGSWKAKGFTIILWDKALDLLKSSEIEPDDFNGKWISVSGILTAFNRRPQIAVDLPTEIEILTGEDEAAQRYESGRGKYSPPWLMAPSNLEKQSSPPMDPRSSIAKVDLASPTNTIKQSAPVLVKPLNTGGLDVSFEVLKKLSGLYGTVKPANSEIQRTDDNKPLP